MGKDHVRPSRGNFNPIMSDFVHREALDIILTQLAKIPFVSPTYSRLPLFTITQDSHTCRA